MYFNQQLGLSDISSCGSYLNVYVNVGPDLSNQVRVLLLFVCLVGWSFGSLAYGELSPRAHHPVMGTLRFMSQI